MGSSKDTTATSVDIPDYIKDPHKDLIRSGERLAKQPYQMFPHDAIADLSPLHQAGL